MDCPISQIFAVMLAMTPVPAHDGAPQHAVKPIEVSAAAWTDNRQAQRLQLKKAAGMANVAMADTAPAAPVLPN